MSYGINGVAEQTVSVTISLPLITRCQMLSSVSETSDGKILVKNCYVAEGNGDRFLVIDARGYTTEAIRTRCLNPRFFFRCAIDPAVIPDLNYDNNATTAWVRTYAFKFADTPNIAFSCTIQVCFPDESDCDDVTVSHEAIDFKTRAYNELSFSLLAAPSVRIQAT